MVCAPAAAILSPDDAARDISMLGCLLRARARGGHAMHLNDISCILNYAPRAHANYEHACAFIVHARVAAHDDALA